MKPGIHMLSRMAAAFLIAFFAFGVASAEELVKIVAGPMFSATGDGGNVSVWFQTNRDVRLSWAIKSMGNDFEGKPGRMMEETWQDRAPANSARNIFIHEWPIAPEQYTRFEMTIWHQDGAHRRNLFKGDVRAQPRAGKPGLYKIAFGSCSHQEKFGEHQPIWDAIVKEKPDCFLFIGDNIYLPNKLKEYPGTRAEVFKLYCDTYDHQRQMPEMQALLRSTYSFALWDDHDFGKNNSNRKWPWKGVAREALNLYFPNNYGLPDAKGCFYRFAWGDIDVFMTDDRSFRDPNDDPARRTFLGEKQLAWLKDGLAQSKASFKLIVCGNQILADTHPHESWGVQFRPERDAFLGWLWEKKITGVIFLSGDRHFAELTRKRDPKGKGGDLWELTSSPLANDAYKDGPTFESPDRVAAYSDGVNFGVLDFDTTGKHPRVELRALDVNGKEVIRRRVELP